VDIQVYDGGAKGSPLGLFCSTVYPRTSVIRKTSIATHDESAPHAHRSTEDHDHQDSEASPHACNDGSITIGQIALEPETGEEVEEFALYLCRRCADDKELDGPEYPPGLRPL
jgi:hypothetical protein